MKRVVIAAVACALLAPAAVKAQVRATLLLKNGTRVTGSLVDLNASGFIINADGRERQVPPGDVSVVDFEGGANNLPQDEASRAGNGLVVQRGGGTVEGRLSDIGGRDPLRLTVDTPSGQRDFSSNEVSRIYLSRPPDAAIGSGGGSGSGSGSGAVTVRGNQTWTRTGVFVRQGQMVSFRAGGEIRLSADENDKASPDGSFNGRYDGRAPLRNSLVGALIGRVGNSAPFGIGNQQQPLRMPATGELWLGVNDGQAGDNSGQIEVVVSTGPQPRR
jgi:hypothetical protein